MTMTDSHDGTKESIEDSNPSVTQSSRCNEDDKFEEILERVRVLYANDKIMSAMRLLQTVPSSCYKPIHHHIQREGLIFEKLLDQSNDHHSDEWIKQGEQHGMFNFCMYYKVSKENQLTCRIETPICAELLVPLLSVLVREIHKIWHRKVLGMIYLTFFLVQ